MLYPTPNSGEDDFIDLAQRASPATVVRPVCFSWPNDVGDLEILSPSERYEAVPRLGSDAHLRESIPPRVAVRDKPDVSIFGVTSASFLQGRRGVWYQLDTLAALTSATAAFQRALSYLGISYISLASIYHPDVSEHFIDRLLEVGVRTVGRVDDEADSDREVADWGPEQITELVRRSLVPEAQAVVVPETALHTANIGDVLDAAAGIPVLTATQVSLWDAYRLAGLPPVATSAGALFQDGTN